MSMRRMRKNSKWVFVIILVAILFAIFFTVRPGAFLN